MLSGEATCCPCLSLEGVSVRGFDWYVFLRCRTTSPTDPAPMVLRILMLRIGSVLPPLQQDRFGPY